MMIQKITYWRDRYNKYLLFLFMFFTLIFPSLSTAATPPISNPDRLKYKPLSFTPPKAERVKLDNGLILYVLEDHELPLLKITALVRTGTMYDLPGREGMAELTATSMKTGGVSGMTGNAVDDNLAFMAASLQISVKRDSGIFSLSLTKKDLEKGLDIFARILMNPIFEEKKVTLEKELKIEELRRIVDDPQKLAFREFGRFIHEGSPRGRIATPDSIRHIHRDDLVRCHNLYYHPERVMISINGDIHQEEAKGLINRYFGSWRPAQGILDHPSLPTPKEGWVHFFPKDLQQSVIIFGWLAPSKNDDRFFPFEVLDFIVGSGGFRSRIFQEIRTNRGLAYSTGSFYTAKGEYGFFGAYALTKSDSTKEVLSLIRGIIQEVGQKKISVQELERAKKAILNSFIFSFTSSDRIAFQQMMLEYENLPEDHLIRYRRKIENVSAEDIKKAARDYLDPKKATILIVGNNSILKDISGYSRNIKTIEIPMN